MGSTFFFTTFFVILTACVWRSGLEETFSWNNQRVASYQGNILKRLRMNVVVAWRARQLELKNEIVGKGNSGRMREAWERLPERKIELQEERTGFKRRKHIGESPWRGQHRYDVYKMSIHSFSYHFILFSFVYNGVSFWCLNVNIGDFCIFFFFLWNMGLFTCILCFIFNLFS